MSKQTKRRIAIYARVSTEHEAQLFALDNQVDWYDSIMEQHPEWLLVQKYVDRGITGTQAKKRPQFMKMIEDAKDGDFELIVTREVSRFARNTVDTLQFTRELKAIGVEVFFVNDNIRTFDGDGELRLTIMATLAQDESRKTSIRVKAGQRTSMEKGKFFQNGSILGYDKVGDEMVINEEQAATVKMIFDLYNSGLGVRKIQWELEKAGRLTAKGLKNWSASNISRILHNSFYCGIIIYNKEYVADFLEQKKIVNKGEREQLVVEGSHLPIISKEEFEKAQVRLESRRARPIGHLTKRPSLDVWCRLLRCSCGSSFNRVKWHTQKDTGYVQYGYQCYNRIRTGSKKTREKKGLSTDGICETPEIAGWKLQAMALHIFKQLSFNKEAVVDSAMELLKEHIADKQNSVDADIIDSLKKEREKYQKKISNLVDMRTDGEITKQMFLEKQKEFQDRLDVIEAQLNDMESTEEIATEEDGKERLEVLRKVLLDLYHFEDAEYIPEEIIEAYVEYIVVDKDTFYWKFRHFNEPIGANVQGRKNKFSVESQIDNADSTTGENTPLFATRGAGSDCQWREIIEDSLHLMTITVTVDDERDFLRQSPKYRKCNKYQDLVVELYI